MVCNGLQWSRANRARDTKAAESESVCACVWLLVRTRPPNDQTQIMHSAPAFSATAHNNANDVRAFDIMATAAATTVVKGLR